MKAFTSAPNCKVISISFNPRNSNMNAFFHYISQLSSYLNSKLATWVFYSLDQHQLTSHLSPSHPINNSYSLPNLLFANWAKNFQNFLRVYCCFYIFSGYFSTYFCQISLQLPHTHFVRILYQLFQTIIFELN